MALIIISDMIKICVSSSSRLLCGTLISGSDRTTVSCRFQLEGHPWQCQIPKFNFTRIKYTSLLYMGRNLPYMKQRNLNVWSRYLHLSFLLKYSNVLSCGLASSIIILSKIVVRICLVVATCQNCRGAKTWMSNFIPTLLSLFPFFSFRIVNDVMWFQWVVEESSPPISHAIFSCDSQLIYAGFLDGTVRVFGASNLQLRCQINPTAYLHVRYSMILC